MVTIYVTDYGASSGRKRGELEEDRNCTGSVKPDTLMLPDGTTKYNIVDLDDAKVEEFRALRKYNRRARLLGSEGGTHGVERLSDGL